LLAQHAAVLPGNADRMRALLGKGGVVHNLNRAGFPGGSDS
jgi:hypothetical protein